MGIAKNPQSACGGNKLKLCELRTSIEKRQQHLVRSNGNRVRAQPKGTQATRTLNQGHLLTTQATKAHGAPASLRRLRRRPCTTSKAPAATLLVYI